jgi:HD superfamily phosphohydrolase
MRGYKRIRIFPERDLRATRFEMAVIDCRVMQRLRDVRQLGQSYVTFPTAEHSRFSHALGALYWSTKMVSYLRDNYFSKGEAGNEARLEEANRVLKRTALRGYPGEEKFDCEVSWFEQLIRLAALLHDVSHLPYGHTLEDQAGLLPRHDEDPERIREIFRRLNEELKSSPHLRGEDGEELLNILVRLLEQCQNLYLVGDMLKHETTLKLVNDGSGGQWSDVTNKELLPYLVLVYDIVNNTICADLIDYLHRDSLNCGRPWTLDKALLSHLKIVRRRAPYNPDWFRLGVAIGRNGKLRHDVVTAVLGLLRARYDITEKVYYHHTKCAADAMLEKAIRSNSGTFHWKEILDDDLGDEGLMHYLAKRFEGDAASSQVLKSLRSRRFHKAIYRLRKGTDWSTTTTSAVDACKTPAGRSEMEVRIAERCKIPADAVIVSCLPANMQLKEAKALVEWPDGEVLTLADLPEKKHYLPEVKNLRDRYLDLWSLTVYLDQGYENHAGVMASVCEKLFDRKNDHLIAEYIRNRYPKAFEIKEYLDLIAEETEVAAIYDLNVAYGGGSPAGEKNVEEVVLDHIESRVAELRKTLKPGRHATNATPEKPVRGSRRKRKADTLEPGMLLEPAEEQADEQ